MIVYILLFEMSINLFFTACYATDGNFFVAKHCEAA